MKSILIMVSLLFPALALAGDYSLILRDYDRDVEDVRMNFDRTQKENVSVSMGSKTCSLSVASLLDDETQSRVYLEIKDGKKSYVLARSISAFVKATQLQTGSFVCYLQRR